MKKRFSRQRRVPAKTRKDVQQDRRINRIVRKLQPEKKYVESRVTSANFVAAGAIVGPAAFNGLATGNTNGTRIGNKVNGVSMQYEILLLNPGSSAVATNRLIFFVWLDDSVPTVAEILNAPGGTTDSLSPIDLDAKRAKFKILKDVKFVYGRDFLAATTLASDGVIHRKTYKFNLKGLQTVYDGNNSADMIRGGLYVLAIGSAASTYEMTGQYVYTDA